jgi:hypothetical protein
LLCVGEHEYVDAGDGAFLSVSMVHQQPKFFLVMMLKTSSLVLSLTYQLDLIEIKIQQKRDYEQVVLMAMKKIVT